MSGSPNDALLNCYLLGSCSEDERARVEAHFFENDDTFARLRQLEEEVIERHLRGELTEEERAQFEREYGRPPRRQRLLFTLALRKLIATSMGADPVRATTGEPAVTKRSMRKWLGIQPISLRFAFAAASVVLAVGLSLLIRQTGQLRSSLASARTEEQRLRQQNEATLQRATELERTAATLTRELSLERAAQSRASGSPVSPRPVVATFVLSPGLVRAGREASRLVIPRSVDQLRLQLDLDNLPDYKSFRVELRTSAGDMEWSEDVVRPRATAGGRAIVLTVPAAVVGPGEHELTLRGLVEPGRFEDASHYYFDALKP